MSYDLLRKRLVIIDELDFGHGLKFIIGNSGKFNIVGVYQSYEEAFLRLKNDRPDIIILDIDLNGMSGIEFMRKLREDHPHILPLVVSRHDHTEVVAEAFANGAAGYILKTTPDVTSLVDSLETIVGGGVPLSSRIARVIIDTFRKNAHSPLTSRETEVMKLIAKGFTYSQIGRSLNISRETSKSHLRNIYRKLEVTSKSQAISKAMTEKLI